MRTSTLRNLAKLLRDENAPTAVEYALMLAAVTGVIIAVVMFFGGKVNNTFNNVTSHYP